MSVKAGMAIYGFLHAESTCREHSVCLSFAVSLSDTQLGQKLRRINCMVITTALETNRTLNTFPNIY